jgi:hypothetical protein
MKRRGRMEDKESSKSTQKWEMKEQRREKEKLITWKKF